jgi:hypothetical protein
MTIQKERPLSPRKIAQYCQVNFKTVLTWIEKGQLKGAYRLPGGSNRVAREDVVNFLYEFNMPIPHELEPNAGKRVLSVSTSDILHEKVQKLMLNNNYVLKTAQSAFAAGVLCATYKPNKLIIDMDAFEKGQEQWIDYMVHRELKYAYEKVTIVCVATVFAPAYKQELLRLGVDACIAKNALADELVHVLS